MQEIWKDVSGYDGLYQISNFGRFKTFKRNKCRIPKLYLVAGYYQYGLSKNAIRKFIKIHRLVGFSFIPNPYNKPYINHKDGNKLNNHYTNLEWCTPSENMLHAYANGLIKPAMLGRTGKDCPSSKPVYCYKDGIKIKKYNSAMEAFIEIGVNRSNISQVVKNKRKNAGGYQWKYV